jgi:hypothetical protein
MAQYEDLQIDGGTDVVIQLECYNPDGSRKLLAVWDSDVAALIPAYTVEAKFKKTYNTPDSDAVYFTSSHLTAREQINILELQLTNQQTSVKPGRYVYNVDISTQESDGTILIERILEGQLTITPSL